MAASPGSLPASALDDGIPMEKKGSKDRPSHQTQLRPVAEVTSALRQLETVAGGRPALLDTLTSADNLTPEEENLLRMLADPIYTKYTLARLCHMNQVSMAQFLRLFSRAKGAQAYITAITRIYDKLPSIAEDVAMRSLPHTAPCNICDSQGTTGHSDDGQPIQCKKCKGKGLIPRDPDLDRQEWSLQIGGLLPKSGGVTINNQLGVQINGGSGLRNTSDFRAATDRLLHPGKGRVTAPLPHPSSNNTLNDDTVEAELIQEEQGDNGEPLK